MDYLLQEAGDVIPAACGPYKRVGLHGDVSSHELGRFLPTGATAVANSIMIHAKPRKHHQGNREMISCCIFDTSGSSTGRIFQLLLAGTNQQGPFPETATLQAQYSRVANLVGNGEGCGQANVLIDAAASFSFAHPADRGQA